MESRLTYSYDDVFLQPLFVSFDHVMVVFCFGVICNGVISSFKDTSF